jgi:hypothetical protein
VRLNKNQRENPPPNFITLKLDGFFYCERDRSIGRIELAPGISCLKNPSSKKEVDVKELVCRSTKCIPRWQG